MLDAAARSNPDTTWWLKGDGADIVPGLQESVRRQWSGDVDLDDGKLEDMYQSYIATVEFVKGISFDSTLHSSIAVSQLEKCLDSLKEDKALLIESMFEYFYCNNPV